MEDALKLYKQTIIHFIGVKSSNDYCTYLRNLEQELNKNNKNILDKYILPQIGEEDAIENICEDFDNDFSNESTIGNYSKPKCRSALLSLARFILGQYSGDIYLSLKKSSDLENCIAVAKNAIFCTIDVAEKVRTGKAGSKKAGSKGNGDNKYYSWFNCKYRRKRHGEKRWETDANNINIILDDNSKANEAIKNAVIEGMPKWLKKKKNKKYFDGYMACHIWDKTCYNERFHTSVFNIVLLPKSIGGLSDYCDAVKQLLQYEASKRFGVYPGGFDFDIPKKPNYYDDLDDFWRQPSEHEIAKNNINNPKELE